MKTAIIILTIICIVSKLIAKGFENYIRNDKKARVEYYFREGATTLGCWFALFHMFFVLAGVVDLILLLILLLGKI